MHELDANDKKSALKAMCLHAQRQLNTQEDLYASVCKRESLANTAYGNLVALPHTNHTVADHMQVSVAILGKPIDWGGQDVQVVFLMLMGRQEGYDLRYFYEMLSSVIFDKALVRELIRKRDYEKMIQLFQQTISEAIGG